MIHFKPAFIPTLFTVPALIVLLALGTWQVQRLNWKLDLIETINHQVSLPAMDFPETPEAMKKAFYRRVLVGGRFLHDKEIHLFTGPKVLKGKPGYNILTPLERADGSVILVDRGWVPTAMKAQEKRPQTLVAGGEVWIEGMLHRGEKKKYFTPENDIRNNLWYWIDMDAVEAQIGRPLEDVYVRALKSKGDPEYPVAGDATVERRNDHLQYAITWYSLAIILMVIYVLYHTQDQGNAKKQVKTTQVKPAKETKKASIAKKKTSTKAAKTKTTAPSTPKKKSGATKSKRKPIKTTKPTKKKT